MLGSFRPSIRTKDCQHIILDAGHIAVQSDLVSKEALNQIESKKAQKYETEDFEKLEALMYDRFTVRLESTQVRPLPVSGAPIDQRQAEPT